jgi:hypothetical protein
MFDEVLEFIWEVWDTTMLCFGGTYGALSKV